MCRKTKLDRQRVIRIRVQIRAQLVRGVAPLGCARHIEHALGRHPRPLGDCLVADAELGAEVCTRKGEFHVAD